MQTVYKVQFLLSEFTHVKLVCILAGVLFPTTNHNLFLALDLAEAWYDQSWPRICSSSSHHSLKPPSSSMVVTSTRTCIQNPRIAISISPREAVIPGTARVPYRQSLRLRRICSRDEDFQKRSMELKDHLLARGYEERSVDRQIERAASMP